MSELSNPASPPYVACGGKQLLLVCCREAYAEGGTAAPAAHEPDLSGIRRQHYGSHIRIGRACRQLSKAGQDINLCNQGIDALPHLAKRGGHADHLQRSPLV
jgi:hypothetical protein